MKLWKSWIWDFAKSENVPKFQEVECTEFQEVECTEISRSGMYRNQDYLPINPKNRRKSTQKKSKNLEENPK